MTIGAVSAIGAVPPSAGGAVSAAGSSGGVMQVGYGASVSHVAGFEAALMRAAERSSAAAPAPSQTLRSLMQPLDQMDQRAQGIAHKAAQYVSGAEMSPGDIVMMTVRCQEFMFQCQLTSNAANRVSDGLQQLFRQQG